MLKELSIESFKSWENTGNMRLAPLTGLFGANSSGKTSILQFLLMLKQTTDSTDRTQIFEFGNERTQVSLGTFEDVLQKHQDQETLSNIDGKPRVSRNGSIRTRRIDVYHPLKWKLNWKLPKKLEVIDPTTQKKIVIFSGDEIGFAGEIVPGGKQRFRIDQIKYVFSSHEFGMKRKTATSSGYTLFCDPDDFHFIRAQGRAWSLPSPVKCYGFPDQVRAYYQNAGFLSDLELEFEKLFSQIYYLGPLREYPKREYAWGGGEPPDVGRQGEKAVEALLASSKHDRISRGRGKRSFSVEEYVAYWLKELGLIYKFEVKRVSERTNLYQVWLQKSPKAQSVRITDVGFGVSQILPVLVLCYYVPKGSIVLLEQPEIHLHPSAQSGLADVFIDAIKTRDIQIIVESHSEHLLKRLQRRIAEDEFKKDKAAIYFCEMKDGVSHLKNLDMDMFGNIMNWPDNFFGDSFGEMSATSQAIMDRKREQGE